MIPKSHRQLNHPKRRIRKKWRIGEFTEWGRDIEIVPGLDIPAWHRAIDAVERIGLQAGGGGNREADRWFLTRRGGSVTLDDVEVIRAALPEHRVTAGPPFDAWG